MRRAFYGCDETQPTGATTPPPTLDPAALQAKVSALEAQVQKYEKQMEVARKLQRGYQALKTEGDPAVVAYFEARAMDRPAAFPKPPADGQASAPMPEDLTPEQQETRALKAEVAGLKTFFNEKFTALLGGHQRTQSELAWSKAKADLPELAKYKEKIVEALGGDSDSITDPKVIATLYKSLRHDDLEKITAAGSLADLEAGQAPRPSARGAATVDLGGIKDPTEQFMAAFKAEAVNNGISLADAQALLGR